MIVPPITLVTQMFPPAVGGSGVLLENIYSRLACPVTVLTDVVTTPVEEPVRGRMQVRQIPLDGRHWGFLKPAALRQHVRVAREICRVTPAGAIVHCGRAQPEGIAALLAAWRPGGPRYLFWAHGEEITTALTSRELGWVMRRVHRGAVAAIANSQHTAATLAAAGMPRERIHVVYPGVDADRFSPTVAGDHLRQQLAPPGALIFSTIGRVEPRKGHVRAVRALAALRHRLPLFRYVIVGDGSERPALDAAIAETAMQDLVVLTGQVADHDLPAYFVACDVFLHPNRVVEGYDFEGFGIVFLEAAAAGKPVIGGASGGVPEAVADGITGLLVPEGDAEALQRAIERLSDSETLRLALGRAGRQRVLSDFTWTRAAARVAEIHAALAAS
jgi:phosphatidylinositol alpha-1,6-mannosyltransferase